jgi:hypothetical protein
MKPAARDHHPEDRSRLWVLCVALTQSYVVRLQSDGLRSALGVKAVLLGLAGCWVLFATVGGAMRWFSRAGCGGNATEEHGVSAQPSFSALFSPFFLHPSLQQSIPHSLSPPPPQQQQ